MSRLGGSKETRGSMCEASGKGSEGGAGQTSLETLQGKICADVSYNA